MTSVALRLRRSPPQQQPAPCARARRYRKKVLDHEAAFPAGCFAGAKALLLYAMLPYDLSFFGMMRQPSLFAVNLVFLFPLFGADSVCVITLWLALLTLTVSPSL